MTPLLSVEGVVRAYRRERVLHGVSLSLAHAATLGIVGESGSGKSTLARTILALDRPQAGRVLLDGADLFSLRRRALREARRKMQAVFQDPYGSLDPRMTIGRSVAEPLLGLDRGRSAAPRVAEALDAVGLPDDAAGRYPHEFSGGQRQRIAIARALVTRPALIVADEPVSALDVSIQAQVLNLMLDLQARHGIAWVFISHDLAVVRGIAAQVAVLYRGRVVEQGGTPAVFSTPQHPYTRALLAAIPGRRRAGPAPGAQPALPAPDGCPYAQHCPLVMPVCRTQLPTLRPVAEGQAAACHAAGQ